MHDYSLQSVISLRRTPSYAITEVTKFPTGYIGVLTTSAILASTGTIPRITSARRQRRIERTLETRTISKKYLIDHSVIYGQSDDAK